jgi:hypothetical protein
VTPMITPDDFLTRSIILIDPRVPFTDERMPPRLEDTPTPALRRYLNPTTNAPIEAHIPASSLIQTMSATKCTASKKATLRSIPLLAPQLPRTIGTKMGLLSFLEGIPTHLGSVVKVTLRFHPMCPLPVKCHSKICAECGNAHPIVEAVSHQR